MAIKNFKKIEDRKGYLVDDEDRKIFEKEIGKSNFGLGFADMIEFILYDSSDNPLPQGENGKLVRYININDKESQKYFLVSRNEFTKKSNDASEMIFDLEELIRDAGYGNGIFKTQITLLNRRVGSEELDNDKLWIQEISPSRTEVRLLPIKNTDNPNEDLLNRYEVFTQESQFRDDTIYYLKDFINSIDINSLFEKFLRIRGKVTDGEKYVSLIKKEFKVNSVEELFTTIKNKLVEASDNFAKGNNYHITDINYGKPREGIDLVELSISQIQNVISEILTEVIDFYLPKRNIQEKNELTPEQQVTFDEVKEILKSTTSNELYDSTIPDEVRGQIRGCTDSEALNYNPNADIDDGTCRYEQNQLPPEPISGCTDPIAINYNKDASNDDGSCKYELNTSQPTPIEKTTKTWYVWSSTADIRYKSNDSFFSETYKEYDEFTITYNEGSFTFSGDIREIPKPKIVEIPTKQYVVKNNTFKGRDFRDNFNASGIDSYSNDSIDYGQPIRVTYQDKSGAVKQSSVIDVGDSITLCAKEDSIVQIPGMIIIEQGECGSTPPSPPPPQPIRGCTDPSAINYNAFARENDGTCRYNIPIGNSENSIQVNDTQVETTGFGINVNTNDRELSLGNSDRNML